MLSEQMLCRSRKDEGGAGGNHEVAAEHWAGRQRKRKNCVTKRSSTLAMSGRIHIRRGIEECQYRAREQRPVVSQFHVHEWLKQQIALDSISHAQWHSHPVVILLRLHQPTAGKGIGGLFAKFGEGLVVGPPLFAGGRRQVLRPCLYSGG